MSPPPPAQTPASPEKRSAALDGARLLASVAVVWLHVPKTPALEGASALGRFAVPFFTQAAVILAYAAPERRPDLSLARYALGRFLRIYPVFLAWSAFYALTRWGGHRLLHQPGYRPPLADLLWNGTALQLWFLPFILLATVLAFAVRKTTDRWQISAGSVAGVAGVVGAGLACLPPGNGVAAAFGYTGIFAFIALPSVCWAIGLAAARRAAPRAAWETPAAAALGLALWIGGTAWTWLAARQTAAENLAGLGLMLLVLHPGSERPLRPLARLGFAAFGIYLVHPFWLEGFENVLHHFGRGDTPAVALGAFVFATCLGLLSAVLLWRSRTTRWLVA